MTNPLVMLNLSFVSKRWFITGTDTGVGKTTICCALLLAAAKRGLSTAVSKPVETGCLKKQDRLVPEDAYLLQRNSTIDLPLDLISPYQYEPACSPYQAAVDSSCSLVTKPIVLRSLQEIETHNPDFLLIEGAGGLLAPLNAQDTILDMIAWTKAPLLIVIPNRLGTISHTLLTIKYAQSEGIDVQGLILSNAEETTEGSTLRNQAQIEMFTDVPVLGHMPYLKNPEDGESSAESILSTLLME